MGLIAEARARVNANLSSLEAGALQALLEAAESAAENFCCRKFASQTYTELKDGDGSRSLILDQFPFVSLTSIQVTDSSGVVTSYSVSDFVVYDDGLLRFSPTVPGYFCSGYKNVQVVYVAGFDPVPADLQEAIIQLAVSLMKQSGRDPTLSSVVMGDYEESYTQAVEAQTAWTPFTTRTLSSYKDFKL